MPSLTDRLEAIERAIAEQQRIIDLMVENQEVREFVPLSQAAVALSLSNEWLRIKIKDAKAFPRESPYKEGIHWKQVQRGDSYRYLINIREWGKL
jgi:hypothetical protein